MENFRNKQWFKELSNEQKQEICNKFNINESTLKKCCRKNDDGKLVIDLLRIDHIERKPKEWTTYYNILNENKFDYKFDSSENSSSNIDLCMNLYKLFSDNKLTKYKDSLHNNLLVNQRTKIIIKWFNRFYSSNDKNDKEYYANQIYSHIKCLIESDLNLLK